METSEIPTEVKAPWLERMLGNLGERGTARTIFGEPVERSGVTVIPVGKVRFGGGGGTRHEIEKGEQEDSAGGGGGLIIKPVGFIEIKENRAKFRSIMDAAGLFQIMVGVGLASWLAFKGVRALT